MAGAWMACSSLLSAKEAGEVDTLRVLELNEVSVTAVYATKETPVAFQNISAERLKEGNTGQSLPYLLAGSPSLIMTSDGGNGIGYATFRVRGTDANRINFTVDGVPLNDMESHSVFWVNMPDFAASTGNVQIQRGAGTSTNGAGAFGATVSMNTQKPNLKPYAEIQSSAGSYASFSNSFMGGTGLLKDHFIFDFRLSNVQTDGYIDRASVNMSSYFASGSYYHGNTMIRFQTFGSSEKTYQAWNGVDADNLENNRTYNSCGAYDENGVTRFYDNQTDNYWQHHYHLIATQRINDDWDVNLTLHYTDGNGYYEDYKEDKDYVDFKLPNYTDASGNISESTDFIRRKWLDNDFYGAILRGNYNHDHWRISFGGAANRYVGDHFGRVMWAKTAESLPQPDYEYYRNRGDKLDYNVYAKAIYNFLPYFDAYADMQYRGIHYTIDGSDDVAGENLHVDVRYPFFNPKAGLHFGKDKHDAYASFSVAHREPNRDNFTESHTQQPTYETLYDWEAGYSYHNHWMSAGVNLYFMDYDNQLILTGKISDIGEALTSNIKDSYRAGIELSAGCKILPCLQWEGNTTLSRNKILNFTEYVDTYDADWNSLPQTENYLGSTDIAFSPNITANSSFRFHWKDCSAEFLSSYVSRQYLDNTSSLLRSIDPYLVHHLRFGYGFHPKFLKELRLDVCINNLFNEAYETNGWSWSYLLNGERQQECGYFAQAGTNFMVKLGLKF